ncbi:MarR family transcriptional regulator [Cryobacterium sp. 10S3]|uniref:MarR family winged helix-turn-helix transcriptional regulator n=1 Tax=unclassified Cryobacterium TaxID=2649013 RepID=UPI002AC89CA9|nr:MULTISPECIES: MarR family transcriptional regulator [unclassified Cryobacterium]MEB0202948.1 MarR family transcriptional regulator [Cryobacterium sp. 5I3]MEB0286451.1 MarR family transcriptional regulator [Cryobacterium sp. 10S3]WPX14875.1 MarR family transcriptional regulator [Cryobacterium sp. 10S3]
MPDAEESGLDSEFASAEDSTGLMLWRVTNAWQAAQRAALRPFGLTHVQFVLLASLVWLDTDGPTTQRELSRHAGTDPMMTSQVLRTLERKGLVERRGHPTDARAKSLRVTMAGAELARHANAAVEGVDQRFFTPLGAERAVFTGMLRVVLGPAS